MKKYLFVLIVALIVSRIILANQDLVIPKTRLEYVLPMRDNFDEKIQYGLEEIL